MIVYDNKFIGAHIYVYGYIFLGGRSYKTQANKKEKKN